MISVEVHAIQRAVSLEISIDEKIMTGEMIEGIRRILDDETGGYLMSSEFGGLLNPDLSVEDQNICNGEILIYISKIKQT
ncbi:MAG: hypothetical protein IKP31_02470 [Lachnospiraceae bacterium]|nr:hypothetical protein [Lachnospiraceae bacterium]